MSLLEPEEICEIVDVGDDEDFRVFSRESPSGLVMVPERYGDLDHPVMKAGAGDFAKWLRANHSEVNVAIRRADERLVLRSGDYWLPLVFLASDVALPVYLNFVADYLYDKMKGALRGDNARVHLRAEYEDRKTGTVKRFDFEGDTEALKAAIAKFNLNEFLDE